MFKNLSLQGRLLAAFIFMGAIVLIVAIIGVTSSSALSKSVDTLGNNSLPSVIGLWKVNEGQTQIESSERALLNTRLDRQQRQAEVKRIEGAWTQINEGLKQYDTAPRDADEEKIYNQLKISWDKWKQRHEEFMRLAQDFDRQGILNPLSRQLELTRQGGKENSQEMLEAKNAANQLQQLTEFSQNSRGAFEEATKYLLEDIKYNENTAQRANQEAGKIASNSRFWVLVGMLIGPLTAVLFGIYFSNTIAKPLGAKIAGVVEVAQQISAGNLSQEVPPTDLQDEIGKLQMAFRSMTKNLNNLIRQVQQSGIQITTSATQIAASGKELEATVSEQVASTNQVAATAKEIAATSDQLVRTMGNVEQTSNATARSASDSQKELTQMENTMRKLADATTTISSKLGIISEKANNINSIITTITKVADQTNLLSLNAAIEAEKAGEYGTGFAVVAREIRRLADQTAVATLDIESMVREMQAAVSTGVMEMDKFTKEVEKGVDDVRTISSTLESIIYQVQTLTPRFAEVTQGMEAQSQGASQISDAMIQITEASSQTASALREINGAISQLNDAAQGLRQEVSRFKLSNM